MARDIRSSSTRPLTLPDGLYRVTTHYLCAGFVVRRGTIVRCAPILTKHLSYYLLYATRVCD
jgi:hypothetical protein